MSKKIVVIGGVAGGASFAARMRRLDEESEIILIERGEYISFANCGLPYHIGNIIHQRKSLILQSPETFRSRFNVEVRIESEAISVDIRKKIVTIKTTEKTYEETYDYLLLAPGASPIKPPISGIESGRIFTLRSIPDMDIIKDHIINMQMKKYCNNRGRFYRP